jgi:uncharacterized protein YbjQ (UPF0145 family)
MLCEEMIRREYRIKKIWFTDDNNSSNIISLASLKTIKMIITNTETVPGKEIVEILGIARGSTVRARNVGRDIFASLKKLVGGEIEEYTQLQAQSREQAMQRMTDDAERMGADAIVAIRITTSVVTQGAAEILAYGTAVKLR